MHDGSLATLEDVVEYYDRGGRANPDLDSEIRLLHLTADERSAGSGRVPRCCKLSLKGFGLVPPSGADSGGNAGAGNSAGGITATHFEPEELPLLVSPSVAGKGKNTFRMELIPVACWKLNDVRFAFASSFVLPETRGEFVELMDLRKSHPGAPFSVFGHADPTGDDAFNKTLSGHRAESVYAVLIRDTDRWESLYTSAGASEGWGTASIQQMLTAIGLDPGPQTGSMNSRTKSAVEQFQSKNGLNVDGSPGSKTRAKLFRAYMDFLCPEVMTKAEFLSKGADPQGKGDIQGCSEFNPVMVFSKEEAAKFSKPENKGDRDADNAVNRRVMVLLFRPGTVVPPAKWPCPRTREGVEACRKRFWSDGEKRRNAQEVRREFKDTKDTFACRFYHRLVVESPCEGVQTMQTVRIRVFDRFAKPLPFAPCLVTESGKSPKFMRASGAPPSPSNQAANQTKDNNAKIDDAFLTLRDVKLPATVNVKWSRPKPSDGPDTPAPAEPFEFELDVFIDLPDEESLLRLKNLGYVLSTEDEDNIRSFQFDYKERFPDIEIDGTLNPPTVSAIKKVHDSCDPVLKNQPSSSR